MGTIDAMTTTDGESVIDTALATGITVHVGTMDMDGAAIGRMTTSKVVTTNAGVNVMARNRNPRLSGTNCRREFVAAPCALAEWPLATHFILCARAQGAPQGMASPQTIPQVVEVENEARTTPRFGPRSHFGYLSCCKFAVPPART
jgi:hypothetical protein